MAAFAGFSRATIRYLADLSANNSGEWFKANRTRYETEWLGPAMAFVEAMAPRLRKIAPKVEADPRINGSIFRINRDIRFSKDKTPYKDHLDLWFWEGERKNPRSGLFFRLTRNRLILGAGVHKFDSPRLARYRRALADPKSAAALEKAVAAVARAGLGLGGEHYKTTPRELADASPAIARLARFNALHAMLDTDHPRELPTAQFADWCAERFAAALPVHRWLVALA
jgi:uncharacterized protein (TIGR02453 family)